MTGGKKISPANQGPPINAASKDEENFIQYGNPSLPPISAVSQDKVVGRQKLTDLRRKFLEQEEKNTKDAKH